MEGKSLQERAIRNFGAECQSGPETKPGGDQRKRESNPSLAGTVASDRFLLVRDLFFVRSSLQLFVYLGFSALPSPSSGQISLGLSDSTFCRLLLALSWFHWPSLPEFLPLSFVWYHLPGLTATQTPMAGSPRALHLLALFLLALALFHAARAASCSASNPCSAGTCCLGGTCTATTLASCGTGCDPASGQCYGTLPLFSCIAPTVSPILLSSPPPPSTHSILPLCSDFLAQKEGPTAMGHHQVSNPG